jgi:hypothetical protein
LGEPEFKEGIQGVELLKATDIIKDDGIVDCCLVLQLLALATRDEYIKNAVIQFIVTRFREDVRKVLGISFAGMKLHWDEGFE